MGKSVAEEFASGGGVVDAHFLYCGSEQHGLFGRLETVRPQ